jgi:hypothetical protein
MFQKTTATEMQLQGEVAVEAAKTIAEKKAAEVSLTNATSVVWNILSP